MSLIQDALRAGDQCLSVEDLERYLARASGERSAEAEHLACCPTCRMEVELLDGFCRGEIGGSETSVVWWIRDGIRQCHREAGGGKRLRAMISAWLNLLRQPVLAGASCALTIATMFLYERSASAPPLPHTPEKMGTTLRSAHRITGLSPVGTLSHRAREFRWPPVPAADRYVFEARDVSGQLIAKSEVSEAIVRALVGEKGVAEPMVIRWKVKAIGASGNLLAQSEQVEMRIIR